MRIAALVIGIILIGAGIWIVLGNGSYESSDAILEIGPAAIEATHDKAIPQWVGITSIVAGAIVALGGLFSRRR